MEMPPDLESLTIGVTYATFYLIWAALIMTWLFQAIMHPRNRQEWAEFAKITAFLTVMTRTVWTTASGNRMVPQPWAFFLWIFVGGCVAFYLWVILDLWGRVIYEIICSWCGKNKPFAYTGLVIWIVFIAMILYGFTMDVF
jgi:hypothetical protein